MLKIVKTGSSEYVRGSAAVALGRIASFETANTLRKELESKRNPATTRAFIAVALGLVMDRHERPLITRVGEHLNHRMSVEVIREILTFL